MFTVTLFDVGNNQLQGGGDTLVVRFDPALADTEIFDLADGSYLVKYRIESAQDYELTVEVNADSTNLISSLITVVPNEPYAATS